jgi:lipid-A-disaccharide synthase
MNLPAILESASTLGPQYEFLLPVAPTLERSFLQSLVGSQRSVHLVTGALPALAYSRAGIIASGTATVEAAMMGTPFVMVYRVSPLTYFLGRSRVKVPHFAMVNLIAGKEIVPELVQHDFTAERVVARLNEVIPDGEPRSQMKAGLASVKTLVRLSVLTKFAPGYLGMQIPRFARDDNNQGGVSDPGRSKQATSLQRKNT